MSHVEGDRPGTILVAMLPQRDMARELLPRMDPYALIDLCCHGTCHVPCSLCATMVTTDGTTQHGRSDRRRVEVSPQAHYWI